MGMFDRVKYQYTCPKCGCLMDDFQTKDKECDLDYYEAHEVDNFYTGCGDYSKCRIFVEFYHQGDGVYKVVVDESGEHLKEYDDEVTIHGHVITILEED